MRFRKPRGALRLIIFLCETVVESAILTLEFWQQPPQLPGSSLRSTEAHASEYTKNPDSDAPTIVLLSCPREVYNNMWDRYIFKDQHFLLYQAFYLNFKKSYNF